MCVLIRIHEGNQLHLGQIHMCRQVGATENTACTDRGDFDSLIRIHLGNLSCYNYVYILSGSGRFSLRLRRARGSVRLCSQSEPGFKILEHLLGRSGSLYAPTPGSKVRKAPLFSPRNRRVGGASP